MAESLNGSMGAMFIGFTVDAILYGIVIFQVYRYSQNYPSHEHAMLKALIGILFFLDTLQVILTAHCLYHFLISNYGKPDVLEFSIWSLNVEVGVTVLITFLVRSCFAARLWRMGGKNKILVGSICLLSLAQLGLGIGMCALTFILKRFAELPRYLAALSVQFGCAVLADILTTSGLVYYLYKTKKLAEFKKTKSLINNLIIWTVNTVIITGLFEILDLVTWVAMPDKLWFVAFHLIVGKLYTNSLLATLNSRSRRAEAEDNIIDDTISFSTMPAQTTGISLHLESHSTRTGETHDALSRPSIQSADPVSAKEHDNETGFPIVRAI